MSKRKHGKQRNACPICGEPRHQHGLPLTVPLGIPAYWSPGQALAIFELIDEIRDLIAAIYGPQLNEAAREEYQSPPDEPVVISEDELPF